MYLDECIGFYIRFFLKGVLPSSEGNFSQGVYQVLSLYHPVFNIDIAKINVILLDNDRIMRNIICESKTQFLLYESKTQSHCVNHNGRLNINLR